MACNQYELLQATRDKGFVKTCNDKLLVEPQASHAGRVTLSLFVISLNGLSIKGLLSAIWPSRSTI